MIYSNKFGGTGDNNGVANNISASSNSTLTTLTALSLPASQLTGTLPSGSFPALTGDITTSAGSVATVLATVNSNVGSFTAANITVNAKGLITAASNGAAGANQTLSNLTNPTAINQSLTFANADFSILTPAVTTGVSGALTLISGAGTSAATATGAINIASGDLHQASGTVITGDITLQTGAQSLANATARTGVLTLKTGSTPNTGTTGDTSGDILIQTGGSGYQTGDLIIQSGPGSANDTAFSGGIVISSGQVTGTAQSGQLIFQSGETDTGSSGTVSLTSGPATAAGTSGALTIASGETVAGTSGNVTIHTGAATTRGKIQFTDGSEGTAGQIWKSTDTSGSGAWSANNAIPAFSYVSQTSTLNPAVIGSYYKLSGSSFTITLPTAASIAGQSVRFFHNGTNLTQVYTFNTTSSQTMSIAGTAYASGAVAAYTSGEVFEFTSDGSNWIGTHQANTPWISSEALANFYTFTISSGSATIAATYSPVYVFTITAGNTASVGAIYSNNGHNYTLRKALLIGDTTAVFSGAASPQASGTLTYVSGTHTGGNISYSAVAGDTETSNVFTVAKTVASGVTLITQSPTVSISSSGQLYKVSGTGDANITYSALSGSGQTVGATTTVPQFYGSPTNNSMRWQRNGQYMTLEVNYYQATGNASGSGDYLFPMPANTTIDTAVAVLNTQLGGGAQSTTEVAQNPAVLPYTWGMPATGAATISAGSSFTFDYACPYTSTSYRMFGSINETNSPVTIGSTNIPALQIMAYYWMVKFPISGWIP